MTSRAQRRTVCLAAGGGVGAVLGFTALAWPLSLVPGFYLIPTWATVLGALGYLMSRREERLRCELGIDPVTGLGNRSLFQQRVGEEVDRAVRHHFPLALLVIDVARDGGRAKDAVLRVVADSLRRASRSTDVICRYATGQFTLLAPLTTARQAVPLVDRIRASVMSLRRRTPGCPDLSVSIGLAELAQARSFDPNALVEAADEALRIEKADRRRRRACDVDEGNGRANDRPESPAA